MVKLALARSVRLFLSYLWGTDTQRPLGQAESEARLEISCFGKLGFWVDDYRLDWMLYLGRLAEPFPDAHSAGLSPKRPGGWGECR